MKHLIARVYILLAISVSIMGCSSAPDNADAPLQRNMSFSYSEKMTYKGKTLSKIIAYRFEMQNENLFTLNKTITDKYGSREQDPMQVTNFLKHAEVLDVLVSSYRLWRDPNELTSGSLGNKEVVEGTHNGESVYTILQTKGEEVHYNATTGFLEGAHKDLGDKSQTVVRLK